MINTDNKYIMMIEPKSKKKEAPIDDNYTLAANSLLNKASSGAFYKGWHTCACGEHSGSCDLKVGGKITNSLLVHYVREHRSEVPESELIKIKKLAPKFFDLDKTLVSEVKKKPRL